MAHKKTRDGNSEHSDAADAPAASEQGVLNDSDVGGDDAIAAQIRSIEADRDSFRELAQRVQADFENYKKRVAKSDQERLVRAEEQLVSRLLPVIDAAELALSHDGENESVRQIVSSLVDVLTKAGLKQLGVPDEPFDPNLHEAVMHEEAEGDHRILEVFRPGYQWKDRVIRAAMVKVSGS